MAVFVLIVLITSLDLVLKVFHSVCHSDAEPGPQHAEKTAVTNEEDYQNKDVVMTDIFVHDLVDFLGEGAVIINLLPDNHEHIALSVAVFQGD